MKRSAFLQQAGLAGAGLFLGPLKGFSLSPATGADQFPVVRIPADKRHFTSAAVEKAITEFKAKVKEPRTGLAV